MRITQKIITYIHDEIRDVKFEIGGILGSSDKDLADSIVIDYVPLEAPKACAYYPNIEFLNRKIAEWQKDNIVFMGMFHTHFAGVKTLSRADIQYINDIMASMPDSVKHLYFPIYVLPDKKLICYCAVKEINIVKIYEEELHVVP